MTVKINRHYAITLATRGLEHYLERARLDDIFQEDRLVNFGLPGFWFLRRRFDRHEAHAYIHRYHSEMHRYLMGKAKEYEEMVDIFEIERETFIELRMKEARKLIRFERKDDPEGGVYC